ncbi:hypothetical protein HOK68_00695 [Candidatus Woesearchaeota archaeon]|jgi:hypothetical protein|nr:hypothetical protein [Candidatus Woesearchaeota archaeon]MBT4387043.1 hypothetical protein [Candidatus Woesearchaeota archaeon]MBT4595907.1 hypothetical protein [Candidatus Woesearchaeota archaeon]MBT5741037.1 hypothetical protein [Candidatus Woesearchaeota archaeon]MBT6505278.1 hypothetical protein [Candidatus Woesearchaeota archaeon]
MDDIFGYIGLSLILLAYILNSIELLDNHSIYFFIINIFGSVLLTYYAFLLNSLPFLILNVVWVLFSIVELIKNFHIKHS